MLFFNVIFTRVVILFNPVIITPINLVDQNIIK